MLCLKSDPFLSLCFRLLLISATNIMTKARYFLQVSQNHGMQLMSDSAKSVK